MPNSTLFEVRNDLHGITTIGNPIITAMYSSGEATKEIQVWDNCWHEW